MSTAAADRRPAAGKAPGPWPRRPDPRRSLLAPLLIAGTVVAAWPVAAPAQPEASGRARSCQQAITTLEMQSCLEGELERLDRDLSRYLQVAQRRENQLAAEASRPPLNLSATQRLWRAYRDAHCLDLYRHWSGGSIRGVMALSCRQSLARERLRRIWADYLRFPDDSPPLLPEPEPEPRP